MAAPYNYVPTPSSPFSSAQTAIAAQARATGAGPSTGLYGMPAGLFPPLSSLNIAPSPNGPGMAGYMFNENPPATPGPSTLPGYTGYVAPPGTPRDPGFMPNYWLTHSPGGPTVAPPTPATPTDPWGGLTKIENTTKPVFVGPAGADNAAQKAAAAAIAALLKKHGAAGYVPVTAHTVALTPFDYATNQANINSLDQAITALQGENLKDFLPGAAAAQARVYNPLIANQQLSGTNALNAIGTYGRGVQGLMGQTAGKISDVYNQAEATQRGLAVGIQQALAAQNPLAQEMNLGIDRSQVAAIVNQANNTGGNVLGSMASDQIGSLAAERANQMSYANQLPALAAVQTQQAMAATQSATDKAIATLHAQEADATNKMAMSQLQLDQNKVGQDISLRGNLVSERQNATSLRSQENQFNANATQQAQVQNQQAAAQAITAQTSAMDAATSRASLLWQIAKQNGAGTAAETATQARLYSGWFDSHAGIGKGTGTVKVPVIDPKTGLQAKSLTGQLQWATRPAHAFQTSWTNLIDQAQADLGISPVQAATIAGTKMNYGYGWDPNNMDSYDSVSRPLEANWRAALKKANLPQTINLQSPTGQPFITRGQMTAIAKAGGGWFTQTLRKSYNSKFGWIGYIPRIKG